MFNKKDVQKSLQDNRAKTIKSPLHPVRAVDRVTKKMTRKTMTRVIFFTHGRPEQVAPFIISKKVR
jgi:hypothetical protein